MSYLNQILESSLKKSSSGKSVYYPYGAVGRGYFIDGDLTKSRIKKLIVLSYFVAMPIIVLTIVLFGFISLPITLGMFLGFYFFYIRSTVKKLEVAQESWSVTEAVYKSFEGYNTNLLIIFTVLLLTFSLICFWFVITGIATTYTYVMLLIMLTSTIFSTYAISVKMKRD